MWVFLDNVLRTLKSRAWCVVIVCAVIIVMETAALNGDNVCMVKQKYNITKRVKYRAPMSVRTYEWCFSMPPRCSKWNTEMRDLTRLETEERTAEVAVCCPGYKMRDVSCVPICPNGKTGPGCSEDCPDNKWGPNCIHVCKRCRNGFCSPITGECECLDGWQGESCDARMPPTTATTLLEELLTTTTKPTTPARPKVTPSRTTKMTPTTVASPSTTVATPSTTVTSPRTTVTTRETVATTPKIVITSTIATTTLKTTVFPMTTTSPVTEPTTTTVASPSTNTTFTTTTILSTSSSTTRPNSDEPEKTQEEIPKPVTEYDNTTFVTTSTSKTSESTIKAVTQRISTKPSHNTTEAMQTTTELVVVTKAVPTDAVQQKPAEVPTTTEIPTTLPIPTETIMKIETTKKETAVRMQPTTVKFKPKEIWIRPAQKGESPIVETKIKTTHEFPRYRSANNKELTPAITTPKTIIVSIIPTSVSYTTFKKIALTSSLTSTKSSTATQSLKKTENEFTKPMLTETSTPPVKLSPISRKDLLATSYFINKTLVPSTSVTLKTTSSTKLTTLVTKPLEVTKTIPRINRTNSMTTDINKNVSTHVTTTSLNARTALKSNDSLTTSTSSTRPSITTTATQTTTEQTTKHIIKYVTSKKVYVAPVTKKYKPTNPPIAEKESKKANVTKSIKKVTTEGPSDDEEFHILTEPEHITAVMGDKGTERSTIDLISVISIAGGVMMAVITVAVVIVMIERCRKPRYEDVRKINDIRMRVMIDNNDVPPPYVRSIFHTPLPDPPTSEKCHYQPISTLDRNLKQFMRPVVVQTISPIMLENFRGILECHYDHLPRRSHDYSTMETLSTTPSMSDGSELRHLRASVTDSTIEALKCEAKLDVIDNTTSEPLYAEIPCWRPPSEHAIEIMNLNGEAVTEL